MKKCPKCNEFKDYSEYWRVKSRYDGLYSYCKTCGTELYRLRNTETRREKHRRFYRKHKEEIKIKRIEKYYIERDKIFARNKVRTAIRNGIIEKSDCKKCGKKDTVAHHDDYSKPLEVKWLCHSCHAIWHRDNGEGKRVVNPCRAL